MELLFLKEVDSTNKYAKEHIDNIDDCTIVYTDEQTDGRGRLDRKWSFTGKDNIYASFVLKPSDKYNENYSNLTQYLCLILAETFETYGIEPKIKWPNDIQVKGKKISGILAEAVINHGKLKGIVLGVGVNLNTSKVLLDKINQPATALNIEVGHSIDRDEFLKKLTDKFFLLYNKFIEEGFLLIREDYIRRAGFLNKKVTVRGISGDTKGLAIDVTKSGALKIMDENNKEHVLLIGDIL